MEIDTTRVEKGYSIWKKLKKKYETYTWIAIIGGLLLGLPFAQGLLTNEVDGMQTAMLIMGMILVAKVIYQGTKEKVEGQINDYFKKDE